MNDSTFDAVFWSFFITSVIGCLLKFGSMAYKTKCKEIECCGVKITRDIQAEEKIDEKEIKNKQETSPSNKVEEV
jgi:hypothetical protein